VAVHYNGRSDFVVGGGGFLEGLGKGGRVKRRFSDGGAGKGGGEVFAIKNTCRDMGCGTEYCFYPGNK